MSFLKTLFKPKNEDDFETVLAKLAEDVRKRQTQLSEIRLRERWSTLLVTLYTLAAWGAYISLWYMKLLPQFHATHRLSRVERAIKGIPVFLGPILILFIRRIVQIWYRRKGDAEEKTLQELMKKQRNVVEDIKKKTNYYSTQELLSKYDTTPMNSPLRQGVIISPAAPSTPRKLPAAPVNAKTPIQMQPCPAVPPSPFPLQKQWYDKLADLLLGDEGTSGPTSRFALICESCRSHNGLVKESLWEETEYICPKCNHFNPAPRARRSHEPSRSISPRSVRHSSSPEPQQRSTSISRAAQETSTPSPQRSGEAGMMEVD
ncbi:hypothetical protein AX15_003396 [Amanita polypyramis BW_CC]|nr:hypothetical protein AX15_003396 [Amanita polypyramis BW_CC]